MIDIVEEAEAAETSPLRFSEPKNIDEVSIPTEQNNEEGVELAP